MADYKSVTQDDLSSRKLFEFSRLVLWAQLRFASEMTEQSSATQDDLSSRKLFEFSRLVLWAQLRFASEMTEQSSVTQDDGTIYDKDVHLLF